MACRKENGDQILLKMSLAEPKDSKDENFKDLKLLKKKKQNLELQNEVGKNYFLNQRGLEKRKLTRGS